MKFFYTRKLEKSGYRAFYLYQENVRELPTEQAVLTPEELTAYFAGREVYPYYLEPDAFDQLAAQKAVEFPALRTLFRPLLRLRELNLRYGTFVSDEDGEYCYPRSSFAPGYVVLHTFDPARKHTVSESFTAAEFTDPRSFFCLGTELYGNKLYDLFAEFQCLQTWVQEELDALRK